MKEKSWVCTLIIQLSLCIAVYVALNIGQPQNLIQRNSSNGGRLVDMYFMTVSGGFRPPEEQILLLQQMAKVVKTYKARFIIHISEFGESNPLLKNAAMFPELQHIPWYTTGALGGEGKAYFLKKIEIPYGQTLDITVLDTRLFQNQSSLHGNDQIRWLKTTLEESHSDWRIVVAYHHISCDYNIRKSEEEAPSEPLHKILLQYGVDAYISTKFCSGHIQGGAMGLLETGPLQKGPYITALNQRSVFKEERVDGFLLHRVSSLELATFAVKSTGEVEHKVSFPQRGKAVM